MASPKTLISSVPFTDPNGNPLAFGSIQLELQGGAQVLVGGGIVDTETIYAGLDASGLVIASPAQTVFFNDQFINNQSVYQAALRDSGGRTAGSAWTQKNPSMVGQVIVELGRWNLTGAGPLDLSFMQPSTTSGVSVAMPFGQVIIPFSATPIFPASSATGFVITLTGNATSSLMSGGVAGLLYTFKIIQDAVGTHTFAWPPNVLRAQTPEATPNAISVQTFYFDGTNFIANGDMTTTN